MPVDALDEQVLVHARRWNLRVGERLTGGSVSDVYGCLSEAGEPAVLKLVPNPELAMLECEALRYWDGAGAARVVARADGALLLERLSPGTSLSEEPEVEAIAAAAAVFRDLHERSRPAPSSGFPGIEEHLDRYLARVEAESEPEAAGVAMLHLVRPAALRLDGGAAHVSLVHGDFVSKNILRAGPGRWAAIDPVPWRGDPCADVGYFAAYLPPAGGISSRAESMGTRIGLDPARCARWAAVWAIGEACETWRADSDDLQRWIVSEECAELLDLDG